MSTQQDQTSNGENDVSTIHVKVAEPEHANSFGAIIGWFQQANAYTEIFTNSEIPIRKAIGYIPYSSSSQTGGKLPPGGNMRFFGG